ncbi:uncharacterized protein LOC117652610 isoform X2 [Thrips palmi]|uniref:Uncharacterized protein LOC117652610 isoform X2 n=1 Tax=Thrips palmi TaxID=161013 RepID=A0A6P9A7N6_THRPL|nr:uncharacterized protein LOC117652610 isoform X2 [Thrips palmi]
MALWMQPALLHGTCYLLLGTFFWNIGCRLLAIVAQNQAASMIDDFQRLGLAGLRLHRRIWLGMVKVMYGLSVVWGRTQAVLLGTFFVVGVSCSFQLTHMVAVRSADDTTIWLSIAVLVAVLAVASICSSAQILTDAIRVPTRMQLFRLSFLVKDEETTTEIKQFLEEIFLEHPKMSICRLGVLSKSSIVYIFALANTYIVVLSQFALSIETTTTNFDEA